MAIIIQYTTYDQLVLLKRRRSHVHFTIDYNFGSLFCDYINKVFVGFFIYQFIASFRKYGKS